MTVASGAPARVTLAAILLAGCAPGPVSSSTADPTAGLAAALAGFAPIASSSCAANGLTRLPPTAFGRTLLYRDTRGTILRNDTDGGCERAGHRDIAVLDQLRDRPCQGDVLRTFDPVSRRPTGSCTLGPFVRYARAR